MKKFGQGLKGLSITKKVLLGVGTLVVIGAVAGNNATTLNSAHTAPQTNANQSQTQEKPRAAVKADQVVVKAETETQSVPFTSTTVNDATLPKGQTKVTIAGVNGTETLTYQVTYTNGAQTNKQLVSTMVTTPPVTQVTHVGTYTAPTCPNGTYVNSSGNTVCTPYQSSSTPAGATAKCADGSYSFSQHRSGTCSHHGGVAEWL